MKFESIIASDTEKMLHKEDLVKFVDNTIPDSTPMRDFFRGKGIFLTGGTGFLGQLFVEKLLRFEFKINFLINNMKKFQFL